MIKKLKKIKIKREKEIIPHIKLHSFLLIVDEESALWSLEFPWLDLYYLTNNELTWNIKGLIFSSILSLDSCSERDSRTSSISNLSVDYFMLFKIF